MSRWRDIQKELLLKVKNNEQFDIIKEDISWNKLHGTTYIKKGYKTNKGILLIHGTAGNRYGLEVLSQRLAEAGYFCLSLDLPSHYQNPDKYTIGNMCEMIYQGIYFIKRKYSIKSVSLVTHSIGATAAIFSTGGYTNELENKLYNHHEKISSNIEKIEKLGQKKPEGYNLEIQKLINESEEEYNKLKELILNSLKYIVKNDLLPSSYVLLAPPIDAKSGIPGLNILRKLPRRHVKWIFENLLHKPAVKQIYKEWNVVKYEPEKDPDYINWQFFKTKDISELLEYMVNLKEAPDYIKLIEDIVKFRKKENKTSFFDYYLEHYIKQKPKLFVYGSRDLFLKPFFPFTRKKIEKVYNSCGNAEIIHGSFSHMMMDNPNQQFASVAIKGTYVTEKIIRFLDKNM